MLRKRSGEQRYITYIALAWPPMKVLMTFILQKRSDYIISFLLAQNVMRLYCCTDSMINMTKRHYKSIARLQSVGLNRTRDSGHREESRAFLNC